MPDGPVHATITLEIGGRIYIPAPDPTARDTDGEWPQPTDPTIYVSAKGRYCCDECEAIMEPTGEKVDEQTMNPHIWECPECGERGQV